jgi:hypothetical protein
MPDTHWTKPLADVINEIQLNSKQVELVVIARVAQSLGDNINELRRSLESNAKSSDELATKVHRLNIVLTAATIVGVLVGIVQLFK